MGFMDKAKQAAMQAKTQAQQVAQQGQAKVQGMQASKNEGELLKSLGEAYYNEQRRGGDHDAVVAALSAIDEHHAQAAAQAQAAPATEGAPAPTEAAAGTPAAPPPPSPASPPPGNFTLDDM